MHGRILDIRSAVSDPFSGMWKFADGTTVSEVVPKSGATKIEDTVDHVLQWLKDNKFRLN